MVDVRESVTESQFNPLVFQPPLSSPTERFKGEKNHDTETTTGEGRRRDGGRTNWGKDSGVRVTRDLCDERNGEVETKRRPGTHGTLQNKQGNWDGY